MLEASLTLQQDHLDRSSFSLLHTALPLKAKKKSRVFDSIKIKLPGDLNKIDMQMIRKFNPTYAQQERKALLIDFEKLRNRKESKMLIHKLQMDSLKKHIKLPKMNF